MTFDELARKALVNDMIETTPLEIRLQVIEEMVEELLQRSADIRAQAEQIARRLSND